MMTNNPNQNFGTASIKAQIRKNILAQRCSLSPELLTNLSLCAQRHILTTPAWQDARQVVLYNAVKGELDTSLLLDEAFSTGKTILFPRCSPDQKGYMELAPCKSGNELRPGPFQILEPDSDTCPAISIEELNPQVMILPGVAFSYDGFRLGYGGGYYDRFIEKHNLKSCFLIGFCANFQLLESLPKENWDQKMDAICTENGLFACKPTASQL